MLRVEGLTAGYGNSQVLFDMGLEAKRGEVISMVGRNGMGKTTTVRALMGIVRPRTGQVQLAGKEVSKLAPYAIARLGVGLVPEGRRIFGSLSVQENLVATSRTA